MARKGRKFELEYEWLYKLNDKKYTVTSPAMLYDKTTNSKREVDVLIEYNDEKNLRRRIAIECRDRKKIEDSMWIEQLTTKKEDLELDCIIATTTRTFTKNAIKKAAAHGIIIEKAETVDETTIDNISSDLYLDLLFMKFEFVSLFFKKDDKFYTYKELLLNLDFVEKCELIAELKGPLYLSLDPHDVINKCGFKIEDFYKDNNNNIVFSNNIQFNTDAPNIFKKLNITFIHYDIKATPLKVTYPVNRQISVFTVEDKINKKFKVRYGTETEYYECGYVDDGKIKNHLKLKERKYYRYIGMNMCINTIFPDGYEMEIDEECLNIKMLGEISFENII